MRDLSLITKTPYPSGYANIRRREFLAWLEPAMSAQDLERVAFAYTCSKYAHRGQVRDGGAVRYFEHPKSVAAILIYELQITQWRPIVVALLHDVLEDSFLLSAYRIRLNFGSSVLRSLRLLTKDPKEGYHERLLKYGTIWDWIIKLADRLHNLRTLSTCPKEKQAKQLAETARVYIPLAEKLIARLPPTHRWRGEYLLKAIKAVCFKLDPEFIKKYQK